MPPENQETIAVLRQTIAALNATIVSQGETITYLKWLLGILAGVIATVCPFFVAWIRSLWDQRVKDAEEEAKASGALLERVLAACATLATAVEAFRQQQQSRRGAEG